jgi:hypothetical protein
MNLQRTATTLFLLALVLTGTSVAQNFANPVNYSTDLRPQALVHGDFNSDGNQDIIVANQTSSTLTFFAGKGDGTLSPGVSIPLDGKNPIGLATADFNGDGHQDLAIVYNSGSIQLEVLLGNGDGTFQAPTVVPLPSGAASTGALAAADFNNDQKPDLAVMTTSGLAIFLNNGAASLQFNNLVGNASGPFAVTDFNRDGNLDVAILLPGSIDIRFGVGDGSFTLGPAISTNVLTPADIQAADFNGDGRPDIAFSDSGQPGISPVNGFLAVSLQNPDGSFATPVSLPLPPGQTTGGGSPAFFPGRLVIGDFNGDGKLDIATLQSSVIGGVATGQPDDLVIYSGDGTGNFTVTALIGLPTQPFALDALDLNGGIDIAVINPTTNSISIVLNKGDNHPTLTSDKNPAVVNQSVTLTTTITPASASTTTPSGTITFKDGTTTLGTATLSNATASLPTSFTTVGPHNLLALYSGDATFLPTTATLLEHVQSATTTALTSSPNPSVSGQTITLSAIVTPSTAGSGTPTGTVNFLDNGAPAGSATLNASGVATLTLSSLTTGTHTITANYGGDSNFAASSATGANAISQTVNKSPTSNALTSALNPSIYGQSLVIISRITPSGGGAGTPTGSVTFAQDGVSSGAAPLDNAGAAAFPINNLPAGTHTITATYSGDSNFLPSLGPALQQVVNKSPSTTTLTSSLNPSVSGQAVILSATVTASGGGNGTQTGTVDFFDNGSPAGNGILNVSGVATITLSSLSVGSHTITAVYGGDNNFLTSSASGGSGVTQTVNKSPSTTVLTSSPNPSVSGQAVTLSATVTASGGGSGTPTGTVTFLDNGAPTGNGILNVSGVATLTINSLAVGSHNITATYPGDNNFLASSATGGNGVTQTINKSPSATTLTSSPNPSVSGQPVTLSATVTATGSGSGTPTGTVNFLDNGAPIGNGILNVSGVATLTLSSLAIGSHTITAAYPGDSNFLASSATGGSGVNQTVNKSPTSSTVLSSANPNTLGQMLTLTITAAATGGGAGTPTGTITLTDAGQPIGTATLNNTGNAVLNTSSLTVGVHQLAAIYPGDTNYQSSTAPVLSQTISRAGTTSNLNSNTNPSTFGKTLTLTFVVAAGLTNPSPTGSASLTDGTSILAISPIDANGNATFTLTTLTPGTYNLTASYLGDANFNSSNSPTTIQIVKPDPTGIGIGGTTQDFTVSIQQSQAALTAGQTFTTQITLTPKNGLTGNVTSFCAGLPAATTCTITPDTSLFDGQSPITGTLTITTDAAPQHSASLPQQSLPTNSHPFTRLAFGLLPAFGLIVLSKKARRARTLLASGLVILLMGCGGTHFVNQTLPAITPAGTYTITVQSSAGTLTHTTQLSLAVK